jgi:hypothetical protein
VEAKKKGSAGTRDIPIGPSQFGIAKNRLSFENVFYPPRDSLGDQSHLRCSTEISPEK